MQKREKDIERGKGKETVIEWKSWKSIFHRIVRFAVTSPRALPLAISCRISSPLFEIVASQTATTSCEDKKEEFATPDKLRCKRRHVSPTIFLPHSPRSVFLRYVPHFSFPSRPPSPRLHYVVLVTPCPCGFTDVRPC